MGSTRTVASLFITLAVAATGCAGTSAIPALSSATATGGTPASTVSAPPTPAPSVPAATPRLTPPASAGGPAPDFVSCMVVGPDEIDDKRINTASLAGMEAVKKARHIQTNVLQGTNGANYVSSINRFADQTCDIILSVGFQLDDATAGAAASHPNQKFSTVDFTYDAGDTAWVAQLASDMGVSEAQAKAAIDNVRGLAFDPGGAAMLAGYLAAGSTTTGRVGTFGAMDTPGVTSIMDGLAAGIHYYNKQKGKTVQLLGWDAAGHAGTFTGDFDDETKGAAAAVELMRQGADVIVPVTGPAGIGAAKAVHDATGRTNLLIGVEFDQVVATPEYADVILTSILKRVDTAVQATIDQAIDGAFKGGTYHGTLANGGVGLAPYHELSSAVPASLTAEVDDLRAAIIDGSVTIAAWLAAAR